MNDEDFVRFRLVFLAGADGVPNGEMNLEPGWQDPQIVQYGTGRMEGS